MGSYNSVSKEFVLADDWKEKIQDSLAAYRNSLKEKAGEAMDKAYELQGVPNPKHQSNE
jgi:Tfp pilus assembly protein PilE